MANPLMEPLWFTPPGSKTKWKSSPSAPPAPDYTGAANATAAGNLEAARATAAANRVNQVTPYGNLTYSQAPQTGTFNQSAYDAAMQNYQNQLGQYNNQSGGGGVGLHRAGGGSFGSAPVAPNRNDFMTGTSPDGGWTATQSLAPAQQALLDKQNQTSLGLADLGQQGLGYVQNAMSHTPTMADLPASMVNAGQTGQDALMARFQPQIDQSHKALENQLANQGILPGSEAYNNSMRTQNQSENDLRMQAALNGINVGNTAQNQQLGLMTALQNQPVNMLNAVRTGSQVTNPSFANVPQQANVAGPDLMGAAMGQNQYNLGLYNSKVGQQNSNMGLLGSLGASAMMSPGVSNYLGLMLA